MANYNSKTTFVTVNRGDYPHPRQLVLNSKTTFVTVNRTSGTGKGI